MEFCNKLSIEKKLLLDLGLSDYFGEGQLGKRYLFNKKFFIDLETFRVEFMVFGIGLGHFFNNVYAVFVGKPFFEFHSRVVVVWVRICIFKQADGE